MLAFVNWDSSFDSYSWASTFCAQLVTAGTVKSTSPTPHRNDLCFPCAHVWWGATTKHLLYSIDEHTATPR